MAAVLPTIHCQCVGDSEAIMLASNLIDQEGLRGVERHGAVVTVPGLDLFAAMQVADLAVKHEWMSDTQGAAMIGGFEADPDKCWIDATARAL